MSPVKSNRLKHTWRIPLILGLLIGAGLLAALLGTGPWYPISWLFLLIPLTIIIWKMIRQPH